MLDMVHISLSKIQWGFSEVNYYTLSKNAEDRVETTFSFRLYVVSLWVILVTYFGRRLGKLRKLRPLEGGKVCYH